MMRYDSMALRARGARFFKSWFFKGWIFKG